MIQYAFFDVDGTLSSPRYLIDGEFGIGTTDAAWAEYCRVHKEDSYEYCYGVAPVRAHAEALKKAGAKLFVLSSIHTDEERDAKTKFVNRVYPGLFDDFFYVWEDARKLTLIQEMAADAQIPLADCELVEDTLNTLFKAATLGITPMHISMLVQEDGE